MVRLKTCNPFKTVNSYPWVALALVQARLALELCELDQYKNSWTSLGLDDDSYCPV